VGLVRTLTLGLATVYRMTVMPSALGFQAFRSTAALTLAAACLLGCGAAAAPTLRVSGPLTEEHAHAFENGADFIDNPSLLEGSWLRTWQEDLDRRVSLADAVAVVTVSTLRHDVDLEQRETYRVIAHVDDALHGSPPEEVSLVVRQSEEGFSSVEGNEQRILDHRFVAFIKWAQERGQIVPRWHLSPLSDGVARRVRSLVERTHAPEDQRQRVIIRDSGGAGSADDDTDDEP